MQHLTKKKRKMSNCTLTYICRYSFAYVLQHINEARFLLCYILISFYASFVKTLSKKLQISFRKQSFVRGTKQNATFLLLICVNDSIRINSDWPTWSKIIHYKAFKSKLVSSVKKIYRKLKLTLNREVSLIVDSETNS